MDRRWCLAAVALCLSGAVLDAQTAPGPPLSRTIYITVTDRAGAPVHDLTPEDLEVKEGGAIASVASTTLASDLLHIKILVDDNGSGLFRAPLARFVQRMEGRAVMALSAIVGQTLTLVEFTPDAQAVMKGVFTLNARPGTPDGGQLLEGISEAARELDKLEVARPVIIALTVGGQEHSTVKSDEVLDRLRRSGAALHVFSVATSAIRAPVAAQAPRDLLQENMHLQRVLGDGPKQTGGRIQQIVASTGALTALQHLASELTTQYKVVYTLPAGARRSERLNVSARRKDVVVRAPAKLPT